MAAKQKKAPTRGVETEYSTAPETAVTHMGDENGCGVRCKLIGLQLNVGRSDAQHKSADSSGPTRPFRARLNSFVQAPPCQTCADLAAASPDFGPRNNVRHAMPCLSPGECYDRRVSREGGTLPPDGRPGHQSGRKGNVAPARLGLVDAGVSAGAIRHAPVPGASVGGAVDAGSTLTRLFAAPFLLNAHVVA